MNSAEYSAIIPSPVGKLGIKTTGMLLQQLDFLPGQVRARDPENAMAADVAMQLQQYFDNPMHDFTIDCDMAGTPYQQRVWDSLKAIDPGQCMTYSDVAGKLRSGARAVGGACRHNPIPIIVPCHRVVSKSGVGGYDGDWGAGRVNIKQWLLRHEGLL